MCVFPVAEVEESMDGGAQMGGSGGVRPKHTRGEAERPRRTAPILEANGRKWRGHKSIRPAPRRTVMPPQRPWRLHNEAL